MSINWSKRKPKQSKRIKGREGQFRFIDPESGEPGPWITLEVKASDLEIEPTPPESDS